MKNEWTFLKKLLNPDLFSNTLLPIICFAPELILYLSIYHKLLQIYTNLITVRYRNVTPL